MTQAISGILWQTKLLREGIRPLRLGVDIEVRGSDRKGRGLYALRSIEAGTLVGRYEGPVMSASAYLADESSSGMYAMEMANGDVIDGEDEKRSSFVRFINHSKRKANCQSQDVFDEDDPFGAVYIETIRDIECDEELLFDYGADYWDLQVPRLSPQRLIIDYL